MKGYLESYRGTVKAWECDHVEHFTVAYYFKSVEAAQTRLLHDLGIHPFDEKFPAVTGIYTRFLRELRKGETYFIKSGVITSDDSTMTLGHRVISVETDEECTLVEITMDRPPEILAHSIDWSAPEKRPQQAPKPSKDWAVTATSLVGTTPLNLQGGLSLEGFVHLFSDASVQSQSVIGMTPRYMREERIGFSTMEFRFAFHDAAPRPGDLLEIRSNFIHVGGTSLGTMHCMWNIATGTLLATLTQAGVHLNLDKRRPTALPDAIRQKASEFLEPVRP